MSGRSNLSGAQKRKLAVEKKAKNEEELKKIPKIFDMFNVAGPSTSSAITQRQSEKSTGESDTEGQKIREDLEESIGDIGGDISSMDLNIGNENLDKQLSNVSAASLALDDTTYRYPTDVAFWNISADLKNLQRYWSRLGIFFIKNYFH